MGNNANYQTPVPNIGPKVLVIIASGKLRRIPIGKPVNHFDDLKSVVKINSPIANLFIKAPITAKRRSGISMNNIGITSRIANTKPAMMPNLFFS